MKAIWGMIFAFWLFNCEAQVKAIVFDCDGTLVDSEFSHYMAWKDALIPHGIDLQTADWHGFSGKGDTAIADYYAQVLGMGYAQDILKNKIENYAERQKKGLPSIEKTVAFVHMIAKVKEDLGIKLAVASAGRKEEIVKALVNLDIDSYFDVVLSGHDDLIDYNDPEGVNKPKPYVYLHAAKMLGIDPADCVAVEDSYTGITSAYRAGYVVVAVPNEYTKDHDFTNASIVFESLDDLSPHEFVKQCENLQ